MKKRDIIMGCLMLLGSSIAALAQSDYKILNKIHLEGDGGWDYLNADQATGRLYISHGTVAQVVDLKTKKLVGTIPDTKGIHGIAIAADLNKGFTSNGRDTSVTVFDLKTLEVITRIKVTGRNPDAILYDPSSQKLFTFNGRSSNATVINAKTNAVVATIALDGKPEFPQMDGKGRIYVNIEDKSLIDVINLHSMRVEQKWSIAPGEEPSGLGLDNETHRLFSVCGNKLMVVSDAEAGKVITTLPIGDGCDGVVFDPALKLIYSSNGEGNVTVIKEETKDNYKILETIPTQRWARTITLDKSTHHIYLPTAEFTPAPAGENKRPEMKPGSFVILEIGKVK